MWPEMQKLAGKSQQIDRYVESFEHYLRELERPRP